MQLLVGTLVVSLLAPPQAAAVATVTRRAALSRTALLCATATPVDDADAEAEFEKARSKRMDEALRKGGMPKRKGKAKRTERKAAASTKGFGKAEALNFRRTPSNAATAACACGSGLVYAECCSAAHAAGGATDVTALLRARYTAFAYRLPEFLIATTSPGSDEWQEDGDKWNRELLGFLDKFIFDGLEIDGAPNIDGDEATLAFTCSLVEKGSVKMFKTHERSRFVRDAEGRWLYASGDVTYGD